MDAISSCVGGSPVSGRGAAAGRQNMIAGDAALDERDGAQRQRHQRQRRRQRNTAAGVLCACGSSSRRQFCRRRRRQQRSLLALLWAAVAAAALVLLPGTLAAAAANATTTSTTTKEAVNGYDPATSAYVVAAPTTPEACAALGPPALRCVTLEQGLADNALSTLIVAGDVSVAPEPPRDPPIIDRDVRVVARAGAPPPVVDFFFVPAGAVIGANRTLSMRGVILRNMRKGSGVGIDWLRGDDGSTLLLEDAWRWRHVCPDPSGAVANGLSYPRDPHVRGRNALRLGAACVRGQCYQNSLEYVDFAMHVVTDNSEVSRYLPGYSVHLLNTWRVCDGYVSPACTAVKSLEQCIVDEANRVAAGFAHNGGNGGGLSAGARTGAAAGGAVGGLAVAGGAAALAITARRRRRRRRKRGRLEKRASGRSDGYGHGSDDSADGAPGGGPLGGDVTLASDRRGWRVVAGQIAAARDSGSGGGHGSGGGAAGSGGCMVPEPVTLGPLLGAGSYGRVYKGRWRGRDVAVKIMQHDTQAAARVANEVALMMSFKHPNIVQAYDYIVWAHRGGGAGSGVRESEGSGQLLSPRASDGADACAGATARELSASSGAAAARSRGGKTSAAVAVAAAAAAATDGPVRRSLSLNSGSHVPATPTGRAPPQALACDSSAHALSQVAAAAGPTEQPRDVETGLAAEPPPVEECAYIPFAPGVPRSSELPAVPPSPRSDCASVDALAAAAAGASGTSTSAQEGATTTRSGCGAAVMAEAQTWLITELCDGGTLADAAACGALRAPPRRAGSADACHSGDANAGAGDDAGSGSHSQPPPPPPVHMPKLLVRLREVAAGLAYIHARNVLHGDLKAANVLLASAPGATFGQIAKVSDFGLSRAVAPGATHASTHTMGTVTHMPPELLRLGKLSPAADVYAFGILMWELYAGEPAFSGQPYGQVFERVVLRGERPPIPAGMPAPYALLMARCWAADSAARPGFEAVLQCLQLMLDEGDGGGGGGDGEGGAGGGGGGDAEAAAAFVHDLV